jgi:hypothetical protein
MFTGKGLFLNESSFARADIANIHTNTSAQITILMRVDLTASNICFPSHFIARFCGRGYLSSPRAQLGEVVEDMPFNMRLWMSLHLDGASPHCGTDVRLWLFENCHGRGSVVG